MGVIPDVDTAFLLALAKQASIEFNRFHNRTYGNFLIVTVDGRALFFRQRHSGETVYIIGDDTPMA